MTDVNVVTLRGITPDFTPLGSKVICSGCGLPICEVVVPDAYAGTYPNAWSNVFGNWRVSPPKLGSALKDIKCPACGDEWVRDAGRNQDGKFIHFEGYGWWPGSSGQHMRPKHTPHHMYVVKRSFIERVLNWFGFRRIDD